MDKTTEIHVLEISDNGTKLLWYYLWKTLSDNDQKNMGDSVMNDSFYKLSIYIPTYNREKQLCNQLAFLREEFELISKEYRNLIEVVISDNCSNFDCKKDVDEIFEGTDINYIVYINEKNIGICGNAYTACERTNGEYVWIVSDDDIFRSGVLKNVFDIILREKIDIMFLNHSALYTADEKQYNVVQYVGNDITISNAHEYIIENYNTRVKRMILTSACIIRHEKLEIATNIVSVDSISVYGLSLISAIVSCFKGTLFISSQEWIINPWDDKSWSDEEAESFVGCVYSLSLLKKVGFSQKDVKKMIRCHIANERTLSRYVRKKRIRDLLFDKETRKCLYVFLSNRPILSLYLLMDGVIKRFLL